MAPNSTSVRHARLNPVVEIVRGDCRICHAADRGRNLQRGSVIVAEPPSAIEPKLTVIWLPETDAVPWLVLTLEANASPVGSVSETVTPVSGASLPSVNPTVSV